MAILSSSARLLLARLLFLVLGIIGALGIIDGLSFAPIFPFSIQLAFDAFFVMLFLYLAWRLPLLLPTKRRSVLRAIIAGGLYAIISNALNVTYFTTSFGLTDAAARFGLTTEAFLLRGSLLFIAIPLVVFGALYITVRYSNKT